MGQHVNNRQLRRRPGIIEYKVYRKDIVDRCIPMDRWEVKIIVNEERDSCSYEGLSRASGEK